MEVLHCHGTAPPLFESVAEIRREGNGRVVYPFDSHSEHYLLRWEGRSLGALTVQEATAGELDCEEFYPAGLIDQYRCVLFNTCKMRIQPGPATPIKALRTLIRYTWKRQYARGKRITLVNAERRMMPFYRRIGFDYLPGYDFVHPELATESVVMLMAADSTHRSFCHDLFDDQSSRYAQDSLIDQCRPFGEIATVGMSAAAS